LTVASNTQVLMCC